MRTAIAQGRALWQGGRLHDAAAAFEQAIAISPDAAAGHAYLAHVELNLSSISSKQEHAERARGAARTAVGLAPDSWYAHSLLSRALVALGDPTEGLRAARASVRLGPERCFAHEGLAWAHVACKDYVAALESAQTAVALEPENHVAHRALATIHLHREEWQAAECCYREALRRNPEDVGAMNDLAIAVKRQGRYEESVGVLEHAVRSDPSHPKLRRNLRLQRYGPGRRHLSPEGRTLIADTTRRRRFHPTLWEWGTVRRLQPRWWTVLTRMSAARGLAVSAAVFGALLAISFATALAIPWAAVAGITAGFSVRRLLRWRRLSRTVR